MEVRELFLNDEDDGIYATSIVENPAIEGDEFIALSKHEIKLAEVNPEKQILMGALLIPEKRILRADSEGNPFEIFFSKDTCRQIMYKMQRDHVQSNTTEEHEIKLDGNTIVEIWQKEDMQHDKSAVYGLNDPIGSIMITMHIPDKAKYDEYKESKKGFSLEGIFKKYTLHQSSDVQEVKAEKVTKKEGSTLYNMNIKEQLKEIKEALGILPSDKKVEMSEEIKEVVETPEVEVATETVEEKVEFSEDQKAEIATMISAAVNEALDNYKEEFSKVEVKEEVVEAAAVETPVEPIKHSPEKEMRGATKVKLAQDKKKSYKELVNESLWGQNN